MLAQAGYTTRSFTRLEGTYDALVTDPPAAIILGLHFPAQRHGLDLVTLLKLQPATRNIPVLLTSQDEPFIKASQKRLEQQHVPAIWTITRPFNQDDVLRVLAQALNTGDLSSMEDALCELAELAGCSSAAAQAFVDDLQVQAGGEWFYVFWVAGRAGQGGLSSRSRRVLAFATPDTAMAFAQRNNLIDVANGPRLRRLSLARLLLAMAREPAIARLLLVHDGDVPAVAGQLPDGIVVEREEMLRRLQL